MSNRKRSAGFTLLEMATALAVLITLSGMAVQAFSHWMSYERPRRSARLLMDDLNRARAYAASGYQPNGAPGWSATDRTVNAGIVVSSVNSYTIFVDRNGVTDGDEYAIAVVMLPDPITISAPAVGQEVRFRPNGATKGASVNWVITDPVLGVTRSITVSSAGLSWVN